jgi:hypothetical protein
MAELRRTLALLMLLAAPVAGAGDLESLPATERGFAEKIQAFIKPGNSLEDSLRLLETHRFECREFDNKDPVIHCARMDESAAGGTEAWLYQVMIEARDSRIRTVSPSLGRIRR